MFFGLRDPVTEPGIEPRSFCLIYIYYILSYIVNLLDSTKLSRVCSILHILREDAQSNISTDLLYSMTNDSEVSESSRGCDLSHNKADQLTASNQA